MNPLAKELNDQLQMTVAGRLLSDLGKLMFFPKGIVAQSAEAKEKAHHIDATIGMAYSKRKAMTLPLLQPMLPALSEAEAVGYAPTAGVPALRALWKQQQILRNPGLAGKEFSLPVVVAGLTSGIFQMAELFVNPGDRVIIPDMFWGNYRLVISERRGGIIDSFPFFTDKGGFNTEGLRTRLHESIRLSREAGSERGKVILLLNFPNNPTGYSPSKAEAAEIALILKEAAEADSDILTVHDDAYFGLFYEQETLKESLFVKCSDLHPNILALKVDGATKEEYVWGFRVGFMSFASMGMKEKDFDPLLKKLMGSIRGTISNCPGVSQNLLLKMLQHPDYAVQKKEAEATLTARYHEVRRILEKAYAGQKGQELNRLLSPLPFNSGYFMAFRTGGVSAEQLRLSLLDKGVGSIAIGEEYLRIAFAAVDLELLPELYEIIFQTARELL